MDGDCVYGGIRPRWLVRCARHIRITCAQDRAKPRETELHITYRNRSLGHIVSRDCVPGRQYGA